MRHPSDALQHLYVLLETPFRPASQALEVKPNNKPLQRQLPEHRVYLFILPNERKMGNYTRAYDATDTGTSTLWY